MIGANCTLTVRLLTSVSEKINRAIKSHDEIEETTATFNTRRLRA